ncbi:ThiF family adenylyltransferase [Thermococcus sp. Bubb.Bath]|uniref:ThiF family adenylyltransferase n=1 Tax=Thermococcus sp. Bubb.Bath TaxID=1638242 RepID=UPI00143A6443|nr:ThiF family adenylyltransferase [Thermococcus sp. Bubb.Bath]NJF25856.1 adenylyltransferase [Thermococcus sp. Bubb.Bath]
MLSEEEMVRYDRQIMLWGEATQEKLKSSKVAVVGAGGLGSPVLYYLTATGVGKIIVVDSDYPEMSNLNRQIIHWEEDVGKLPKVKSAEWKLKRFNGNVEIVAIFTELNEENVDEILGEADVVVDCLDSFKARLILDDFARRKGVPLVHGAVEGTYGQVTTIIPRKTMGLRELFGRAGAREKKGKFPIVGAVAGVVGSIQAMEVIKLITGFGEPLANKLLIVDLAHNSFEVIDLSR